jgi:hypothetical protein
MSTQAKPAPKLSSTLINDNLLRQVLEINFPSFKHLLFS